MRRLRVLWLPLLAVVVLAEPPVQYGAPGGYSAGGGYAPGGGYSGGSSSRGYASGGYSTGGYSGGNGQYSVPGGGRETPMFTHEQDFQKGGPGVIWGEWTVALPDGRTQHVKYDADDTGFHPEVTFDEPGGGYRGGGGQGGRGYSY